MTDAEKDAFAAKFREMLDREDGNVRIVTACPPLGVTDPVRDTYRQFIAGATQYVFITLGPTTELEQHVTELLH